MTEHPDYSAIAAQLNDCQACGGRPLVEREKDFPGGWLYHVRCLGCPAWTGISASNSLEDALTAWILGKVDQRSDATMRETIIVPGRMPIRGTVDC